MALLSVHVYPFFCTGMCADAACDTYVVIDVLRSSTSMCAALCSNVRAIVPFERKAEAIAFREEHPGESPLLCGEEGGRPIRGFDLGNSPSEYDGRVAGKVLAMVTTNGTRAILGCPREATILVGGFVNAGALCSCLRQAAAHVALVCAGRDGKFAGEDFLCAGLLCAELATQGGVSFSDGAHAASVFYERHASSIREAVRETESARHLAAIGYEQDIDVCVRRDAFNVLPRFRNGKIGLLQ